MAKRKATKKKEQSAAGVNKAQAIRDYSAKNPEAGPSAIAEALNDTHGWEISAQYVSTIKSSDRRRVGTTGKRGRPAGSTKELSVQKLKKAKQLAEEMGGLQQARAALDALADLIG